MHVRLYTETESQKQILIGKGGSMVREIGRSARPYIEELLGQRDLPAAAGEGGPEVAPQPDDARAPRPLEPRTLCLTRVRLVSDTLEV